MAHALYAQKTIRVSVTTKPKRDNPVPVSTQHSNVYRFPVRKQKHPTPQKQDLLTQLMDTMQPIDPASTPTPEPPPQAATQVNSTHATIINVNHACTIYIGIPPPPPESPTKEPLITSRQTRAKTNQLTPAGKKKGNPIKPWSPSIILRSQVCKTSCKFDHFSPISIQILKLIKCTIFPFKINHLDSICVFFYMCKTECLPTLPTTLDRTATASTESRPA